MRVYKDGRQIQEAEIRLDQAAPDARIAPPSAWKNGHAFAGKICGFSIWRGALDAAAIRGLVGG